MAEPSCDVPAERAEKWMSLALEEARRALAEGEVPIGAVAVLGDEAIACEHNRSIQLNDPTAHAEILALRRAGKVLGNYRLNGVQVYATVEPCAMCAGALVWARVESLSFGARDAKSGAVVSVAELLEPGLFNHVVPFEEGVLETPCRRIVQEFFEARRGRSASVLREEQR